MNMLGSDIFNGIKVVTDQNLVDVHSEQVRFPRSKKKRIRKKWARQGKNYKVWSTPKQVVYKINGDTFLMHPEMFTRLKLEMERQNAGPNIIRRIY